MFRAPRLHGVRVLGARPGRRGADWCNAALAWLCVTLLFAACSTTVAEREESEREEITYTTSAETNLANKNFQYSLKTPPRRYVTMLVTGWVGPSNLRQHFAAVLPTVFRGDVLYRDYLRRSFESCLPGDEAIVSFRWSGVVRQTTDHPNYAGAITQLAGYLERLAVRANAAGIREINVEAHSWGGVLSYFALQRSNVVERLQKTGLRVNLDTLGTPIGFFDSPQAPKDAPWFIQLVREFAGIPRSARIRPPRHTTWRNYIVQGDGFAAGVLALGDTGSISLGPAPPEVVPHSAYYLHQPFVRTIIETRRPGASTC